MTISDDLFRAILAMDSYNRGFNAGIDVQGTSIGNAQLTTEKEVVGASFFAQAYSLGSDTIISYRGSDGLVFGNVPSDIPEWDIWLTNNYFTDQAKLAADFYKQVRASTTNTIETTGHSLGGALAGFIAGIHGLQGMLLDPIGFMGAVRNLYAHSTGENGVPVHLEALNHFYDGVPVAPNFLGLSGYAVAGEIANLTRTLEEASLLDTLSIGSVFGTIDPIALHSQAYAVTMLFGHELEAQEWLNFNRQLTFALYDNAVALAAGAGTLGGRFVSDGNYAEALMNAIAYSAIDEGVRPYGDTGIRALFDDANEIGRIIANTNVSKTIKDSAEAVAKIIVQFGGHLAAEKVFSSGTLVPVLDGALKLSQDEQTLAIDFSDQLWSAGTESGTAPDTIVGRDELVDEVFATAFGGTAGQGGISTDIKGGMRWLWDTDDTDIIDRIVFATTDDELTTTLPDRGYSTQNVSIFAAGGGNDNITGSADRDFIVGGEGNDILRGGAERDLLVGGKGNDRLSGGDGRDFLAGSDGEDTVFYESTSGVQISIKAVSDEASGNVPTLEISAGGDEVDRALGIEKVELTDEKDTVRVGEKLETLKDKIVVDAKGQAEGQRDLLDFSQMTEGVTIKQDGSGKLFASSGVIADSLGGGVKYQNFEELTLTSKDDQVKINGGITHLNTGAGDDLVIANNVPAAGQTNPVMFIDLGAGNDTVRQTGRDTVIYTGDGNDSIEMSHNGQILIADASTTDHIMWFGMFNLTGGVRITGSESGWAVGKFGERYGRNPEGQLIITYGGGHETFIANYDFALGGAQTAGLYVVEITIEFVLLRNMTKPYNENETLQAILCHSARAMLGYSLTGGSDPLVLDLDGDGIELSARVGNGVSFDIDQDGFAERVGWVRGGDALLVRDLNGNGNIDNIGEMFGNRTESGFAHLAALDGNLDGKVDASDNGLADFNGDGVVNQNDTFDALKLWIDENEDGNVDAGELVTLASRNVASISVASTPDDTQLAGNAIDATGTFTRTDGSTGTVANVVLDTNEFESTWLGDSTVIPEAAALANVKGHGTLADLHVAMSIDPHRLDPNLEDLTEVVEDTLPTLTSTNLEALRAAAFPILSGWMAAVPVPAGTSGTTSRPDFHFITNGPSASSTLIDYVVVKTDAQGQYYGLASGTPIVDPITGVIQRPTLQDVLEYTPPGGSDWQVVSGAEIQFLERYLGISLPLDQAALTGGEAVAGANELFKVFWHELNEVVVRLAAQGGLAPFFVGIAYDAAADMFRPTTDHQLVPMLEAIFDAASTAPAGAEAFIAGWKDVLNVVIPDLARDDDLMVTYAYLFQNVVAAYENSDLPLTLRQAASVLEIPDEQIRTGSGTVEGTSSIDLFYLDSSDQILLGGSGHDSYVVGRDFGLDVIQDIHVSLGYNDEDTVRFAQLNFADLTFERDGNDLVITQTGTDNVLRVVDEFIGRRPGIFGGYLDYDTSVEVITFADGTVWDRYDIARAVGMPSRSTDDNLVGTSSADFLNGGIGTDTMTGGDGGDHYQFGFDDGHDTAEDNQAYILMDDPDFVDFGPGITMDDVLFERDGGSNDLRVRLAGTDDTLTITNQFAVGYGAIFVERVVLDQIEVFTFEDGSFYTWEEVMEKMLADASTDGNDSIYGFSYSDFLDGGFGNDFLSGGNEGDTYIFGKDYDTDTIQDGVTLVLGNTGPDRVVFKNDIDPNGVAFSRDGNSNDLVITMADGDQLIVKDQFDRDSGYWLDRIEEFVFQSTDEVVSWDEIMEILVAQAKTSGDDVIYGFEYEDVLDGGAGNDYLVGGRDGDTYIWRAGYGNDTILDEAYPWNEGDNIDKVSLGDTNPADLHVARASNGRDLVITNTVTGETLTIIDHFYHPPTFSSFTQIEQFTFSNGTTWSADDVRAMVVAGQKTAGNDTVTGFDLSDVLDGGAGDDLLIGQGGDDTYVFGRGYGHDTVQTVTTSLDKVVFNADVAPADIEVFRSGDDLVMRIIGTDDVLRVPGQLAEGAMLVETFEFSDGTIWTAGHVLALLGGVDPFAGTPVDDTINGTTNPETIHGQAGNDTIHGNDGTDTLYGDAGNDTLYGDAGNDVIQGGDGDDVVDGGVDNDTLTGGAGNDTLRGGLGDDVYRYTSGDGNDVIQENGYGFNTDKLLLTNLNAADVTFVRTGPDLNDLRITVTATGEVILVDDHFSSQDLGIEQIQFADGTIWDRTQIEAATPFEGTAGADTITGSGSNDTILAKGGDDTVDAGSGNDTMTGGTGADTLRGGVGADVYRYTSGDGNDIIQESGYGWETDKLLLTNLDASDVTFVRTAPDLNDLRITVTATGEVIVVDDHFASQDLGIEQIQFADGTIWDRAQIEAATPFEGTAGADTITGSGSNDTILAKGGDDTVDAGSGNDTITGGTGSDTLRGGIGSDVYRYASGDGNDLIQESGYGWDFDKLVLTNLNAADVTFARRIGNPADLVISVTATGEVITIKDHFTSQDLGIEQIQFADGTTWDRGQIATLTPFEGTAGADTITGSGGDDTILAKGGDDTVDAGSGNDTITGGTGSDTLRGALGNDVYRYASGDGNDVIQEGGYSWDFDKLVLTNLNAADVTFGRTLSAPADLLVNVIATGEMITIKDHFTSQDLGIEQVQFANGTTFDRTQIANATTYQGTSAADTVALPTTVGTFKALGGDDRLSYQGGTVTLDGGDGVDTLDFTPLGSAVAVNLVTGQIEVQGSGGSWNAAGTASNIENLVGSAGADYLTGDSHDNTLFYTAGFDQLNGGGGTDTVDFSLFGSAVSVELAYSGTEAWTTDSANLNPNGPWREIANLTDVENVVGTSFGDYLAGNSANNQLTGGGGNDVFSFKPGFGNDIIVDMAAGSGSGDVIELSTSVFADFADTLAHAAQVGADTVITLNASNTITLQNVTLSNLNVDDFRYV